MAKKIPIKLNVANALSFLGSLYRNPADALKEYVSNALDEWQKARARGEIQGPCEVMFRLEKERITIEYNAPGMDEREFKVALERVADSAKKQLDIPQIGQLGIGIFAFNQIGRSCTFFSKKSSSKETWKVVLRSEASDAEFEAASKKEARQTPGMTIVITRLLQDPTKPRGSLSAERLQAFFAGKFDAYLRSGTLKISIRCNGKVLDARPSDISLPPIGAAFNEIHLPDNWKHKAICQFWFDPSEKGIVAIRHSGLPIIEDLRNTSALGLENSVLAEGSVKGFIDADFLKVLPARTGFEENGEWIQLLSALDKICPSIEAEVDALRDKYAEEKLTEIQKKAIELAKDILTQDQFRDLELLGGYRRRRAQTAVPSRETTTKTGRRTGERSRAKGDRRSPSGLRINYDEAAFEEGPTLHSRFISGTVQVNTSNNDYQREKSGPNEAVLAYCALMIGKETIAYNDKSGKSNDLLEKLLSFHFQVKKLSLQSSPPHTRKVRRIKEPSAPSYPLFALEEKAKS